MFQDQARLRLSPIGAAVAFNNLQEAEKLLKAGANVNAIDFINLSLLHMAVEHPDTEMVKLLLQFGADVNSQSSGCTPLYIAAQKGHEKVFDMLMNNSADVHLPSAAAHGRSPLHAACFAGNQHIVKALIEAGVEVDVTDTLSKMSPIHLAAMAGRHEIVKLLIQLGACVNIRDTDLKTPLICASFSGLEQDAFVAAVLIENGADVNAVANTDTEDLLGRGYGCQGSALHNAARFDRPAFAEVLLNAGADVRVRNEAGRTPLHCAGSAQMCNMLLARGADIESEDFCRSTPLHAATMDKHGQVVSALLQKGANINAFCVLLGSSFTALHLTALASSRELIEILINAGAEKDIKNSQGRTPLHVAACYVRVNHNVTYDSGLRIIEYTTDNTVVDSLLKYGCDINVLSPGQLTALDYARAAKVTDDTLRKERSVADIENHVRKMKATGMTLCEKLLQDEACCDLNLLSESSKNELARMKTSEIGNSKLSFYSLLGKSNHQLAVALKNQTIQDVLNSAAYENDFPNFAYLITNTLRKGLLLYNERKPEIDTVWANRYIIFKGLNDDCVELILDRVGYDELKTLAACSDDIQR